MAEGNFFVGETGPSHVQSVSRLAGRRRLEKLWIFRGGRKGEGRQKTDETVARGGNLPPAARMGRCGRLESLNGEGLGVDSKKYWVIERG